MCPLWPQGASLPILMDDVICLGTEASLSACGFKTYSDCTHYEDVGVDCGVFLQPGTNGDNIRELSKMKILGLLLGFPRISENIRQKFFDQRIWCWHMGFVWLCTYASKGFLHHCHTTQYKKLFTKKILFWTSCNAICYECSNIPVTVYWCNI